MSRKFFKSLQQDYIIQKNNFKTSIYFKKETSKKPIAVLFHGFTGNAFGMSFLAKEMSEKFQIILVEMPNHGKSSLQKITNSQDLRTWNTEILLRIEKRFGKISLAAYHSMSCFSSNLITPPKTFTIFINPVFEIPIKHILGVKISSNPIIALISNLPPSPIFKALLLTKSWKAYSLKNILTNTFFSFSTPLQIIFQAKMAKIPLEKPFLSKKSDQVKMIIIGSKDILSIRPSKQNQKELFPDATFLELNTGHLSPIEIPKEIAKHIITFFNQK